MALLVTGAMGHVGYETVKQAAGRGMSVVAQYLNTFREDDARAVGDGVVWVKCDLASAEDVAAMTEAHDIDGCIHTAAIPNDKMGLPRPDDTFLSNVRAPQLLLESARQQINRVVKAAVREVVGKRTLLEVLTDERENIRQAITERTAKSLVEDGIEIEDVRISRTELPPATEKNVFARMKTDRTRLARKYRAEGEENARGGPESVGPPHAWVSAQLWTYRASFASPAMATSRLASISPAVTSSDEKILPKRACVSL